MASLKEILSWFQTGLFPTADQFRQTWLSYWHKSEKIPQSQIFGLQETIESATRGLIYQNPVTNIANLYTTYPSAKVGWAAMVTSEGYIYSYNGMAWANTGLKEFPEDVAIQNDILQLEIFNNAELSKTNLYDIYDIFNLLVEATFYLNKSTGSTGFIDFNGQAACRVNVVSGQKYTIGGFYPLYGFYFIMQDSSGNQVGNTLQATSFSEGGKTYYNISVPNNSTITQMVFTLYRSNNTIISGQTPFNANTAIMVEYSDGLLFPLERNISSAFAKNIPNFTKIQNCVIDKTYKLISYSLTNLGFYNSNGIVISLAGYTLYDYSVNDKKQYRVNTQFSGSGTYLIFFFDKNHKLLTADHYLSTNQTVKLTNYEIPYIPAGTVTIGLNSTNNTSIVTLEEITDNYISSSNLKQVISNIPYKTIEASGFDEGFITNTGTLSTSFPGGYKAYSYNAIGDSIYRVNARFSGSGGYYLHFYDIDNKYLGNIQTNNGTPVIADYMVTIPSSCVLMKVNSEYGSPVTVEEQQPSEYIYSKDLQADINAIKKEMTGNAFSMEFTLQNGYFLVRSYFDDARDMVIRYNVNNRNHNVSPYAAYIGANTATTHAIVVTAMVHNSYDSTPPFLMSNYWYLFGEHGYLVPVIISNGHDKTALDIGSWWKTSDGKQFQLIKINGSSLTFAPCITKNGSGTDRDKSDYAYGYIMTTLAHVSGATHTTQIVVTTNSNTQWIPFTRNIKKKYVCDGIEIISNGVYKCNELTVVDVHEGYNPITITQYDPTIIGDPLCRLTFTYKFTGLSVFVSNSIEIYYPIWLNYYGAFQPMGLRSSGAYHPMLFIPKVKEQSASGKITVDWKYPQDCSVPNQNWAKTAFNNNANDLIKVDDIPERIIEYHQNPNNPDDYLIGFAAGYSLLSSATVNEKRKNLTSNAFQLSQDDRNKLYIRCIDFNKLNNQVLPAGYVNNFNFYYSYFNPSINTARVYWYKEGRNHIIYVHAHTAGVIDVNLPAVMEGKIVQSIVEATEGAVLLTDTVADGIVKTSFPEGANYIVFVLG